MISISGKARRLSLLVLILSVIIPALAAAQNESLDDLHKKALKEGGTLNFYGTLAQINAAKILPVFEKRFPESKSIT